MFRNYLKIALRTFRKQWAYSSLNTLGLAIALASAMLILAFVQREWSYDDYHPDADRLYRVVIDIQTGDQPVERFAPASGSLGPALAEYPEVEEVARVLPTFQENNVVYVPATDEAFNVGQVYITDNSLFDIFGFELLSAASDSMLARPGTVVIDEEQAGRFFGDQKALGKTLRIDDREFTVSGVMKKVPETSHFKPSILASLKTFSRQNWIDNWMATMFHTYIKLKSNVDAGQFESKIRHIADRYAKDRMAEVDQTFTYTLQPVEDIHLHSHRRYEHEANYSAGTLYIFLAIALLIVLIAVINYVNLSTARAGNRAQEIGVRKVFGGRKSQLRWQFMTESLLLVLAAFGIALFLVELTLPLFNELSGGAMDISYLDNPGLLLAGLGITLIVGLLAGSYPAFVLSGFRILDTLRGKFRHSRESVALRDGLVVLQFAISMILVVATIVISRQVSFMQQQDLGIDKEQVMVISSTRSALGDNQYRPLKQ